MFSSLFGNTISFFFLVFGASRVLFGVFGELFGIFEELLGACSLGVSSERGLPRCCDNPLIFAFLVLLGDISPFILATSGSGNIDVRR